MSKIKYLFLVLTLVFISTSTNALSCIHADEPIKISNDFTFAAVEKALGDLPSDDGYDECLVEIKFDYDHQDIEISFDTAFQSSYLDTNREVRLDFWMALADGKTIFKPAKIKKVVEFACDYADQCDRHFVFDHLEWLFNAKYDKLESGIRPLLTADNENTGKNDVQLS
jgi:hypothetical protein